jgi:peroxiredoxin
MATLSTMMPLGTKAPDFELPDAVTGKRLSLDELKSEWATVVMFICNHCPYVKHIQEELVKLAADYQIRGAAFVAISSNDPTAYPEDAPGHMREVAEAFGYPFPYLFDESQDVARAYQAACTPDFYIFDRDLNCVYRGQLDDSRPGNGLPVTGRDIRRALDDILNGQPVDSDQTPSIGCSIKWKK